MNERKDILERVKHLMKENSEIKVICSKLARQLNCDRRTVSRYIDITRSGKEVDSAIEILSIPRKTEHLDRPSRTPGCSTLSAVSNYSLGASHYTLVRRPQVLTYCTLSNLYDIFYHLRL